MSHFRSRIAYLFGKGVDELQPAPGTEQPSPPSL